MVMPSTERLNNFKIWEKRKIDTSKKWKIGLSVKQNECPVISQSSNLGVEHAVGTL
jgi:hypothetical protein